MAVGSKVLCDPSSGGLEQSVAVFGGEMSDSRGGARDW